jgi:hypothetical protein
MLDRHAEHHGAMRSTGWSGAQPAGLGYVDDMLGDLFYSRENELIDGMPTELDREAER